MRILLNGKEHHLAGPVTLAALIETLPVNKSAVIVEYNEVVVYEDTYEATILAENDKVEVLQFVGGG